MLGRTRLRLIIATVVATLVFQFSPRLSPGDGDGMLVFRSYNQLVRRLQQVPMQKPTTYRDRLEAQGPFELKPNLGFDHIYVISLPHRTDRQNRMTKLAAALELKITFVQATPKNASVIAWIGEQVQEIRTLKRPIVAKQLNIAPERVRTKLLAFRSPESPVDSYRKATKIVWPSLRDSNGRTWIDRLEDGREDLVPHDPAFNVTEALWDPQEAFVIRQVSDAVVATWHSHVRAMKAAQQSNDEMALILEDDVDVEWDIARIWASIQHRLPADFDSVFLGHCWSTELRKPQYGHPLLHESSSPRCLHGYVLSRRGYMKALQLLADPWVAYQRAVDLAFPMFIQHGLLRSFSVEPPLIIQGKDSPSDIAEGAGSPWRGNLADSTLNRIARSEGREPRERPISEALRDPAGRLWFKPDRMPEAMLG